MNNENYKDLYQKYLELREKTTRKAHVQGISGHYPIQYISQIDLEELSKIREKLISYFEILSDDELLKISEDNEIGKKPGHF